MTTAHPHHDVARNELVNYTARFSRVSEYVLYGLPADSSTRRVIARMPVKEPAYMHAFGMSERYLILAEYPLRVNPLKLAFSGKPFIENYTWRADEPTRFQVFDRASGELRGTYETDAFFCFHHVNAFERGGELVIDLCAYDDSSVIDSLYLDDAGPGARCRPWSCGATRSTWTAAACAGSRWPTARSSCRGSTTAAATRATTRTRTSPARTRAGSTGS